MTPRTHVASRDLVTAWSTVAPPIEYPSSTRSRAPWSIANCIADSMSSHSVSPSEYRWSPLRGASPSFR
jgi:hypothetical protein